MLAGYFEAMPDALKMAWRAVKSEDFSSSALTKIESQQMKAITPERFGIDEASVLGRAIDYIGQGVRFPGRLLKAEDEFSRATAQNMELRAQSFRAYKNALENGASEKEAKAIYEEALAGRNDAVNNSVKEFQDMMTFVTPLGETGQAVQKLTQKSALAKIIMPFTRTPTNIFKEFVRRTPAAPLMREVREQIARGGIEADMAISRIATGSVLLGWAGYLVANDVLTGAGPEGALRKQWLENYQPYSIRIGDKWYSYQGLEPVSLSNAPRGMIARAGKMFIYVPWGNLGFFYKDHGHTPDSNLIELGEVEKGLEALAEQKGGFSAEMTVLNGDERP